MDQNIIGLVLKTNGYPEPVTVSGCRGNQEKFKIFISKKFLISPPSKNALQIKFLHLLISYVHIYVHIYEAYGHFNSWKPFVFDRGPVKDNFLFRHHIQNRSFATYGDKFFHNFATRGDKFVSNFATMKQLVFSIFCDPFQSSPFYCLPNFTICFLKSSPNFALLTKSFSLFFGAYLKDLWGIFKPLQV